MKRFLLALLLLLIGSSAFSQTIRYRAHQYAVGFRDDYGSIEWGEWEDCNIVITIDFDNDFIKVYSKRTQNYVVVSSGEQYEDAYGGVNIDMVAVDEEGIECNMRLRIQDDGIAQLYSYYSDVAWVYSDLRKL